MNSREYQALKGYIKLLDYATSCTLLLGLSVVLSCLYITFCNGVSLLLSVFFSFFKAAEAVITNEPIEIKDMVNEKSSGARWLKAYPCLVRRCL